MSAALHDALAGLFIYPDADMRSRVDAARAALAVEDEGLVCKLDPLVEVVDGSSLDDVEELFTRTFDINPACTLECGWHLYGEDYARGTFLVRMRTMLRELGVEESAELPDHVTHVLPVMGRLPPEVAAAFFADRVLPALVKMLAGFKEEENPYHAALVGVVAALRSHHGEGAPSPADSVPERR